MKPKGFLTYPRVYSMLLQSHEKDGQGINGLMVKYVLGNSTYFTPSLEIQDSH